MKSIEIADYVSESEMKAIAQQVFKERCIESFKKDHDRIISNSGYAVIVKIVKENYPEGLEELVAKKAIDVIDNLSSLTLFGPRNAWDRETTGGFEALQKAIKDNSSLINDKAISIINEFKSYDCEEHVAEILRETISDRLFGDKS
tara:strand:+ start:1364 stop:1801 length:438 start_codon:yes stop_codon:yes gene_type:complete